MQIKRLNNPKNNFWEELNVPMFPTLIKNLGLPSMAVNVYEEEDKLIVEISAPGVESKEKFDISLDPDNTLNVSIENK